MNGADTSVEGENGFATLVWVAPDAAGEADPASSDQWWATRNLGDIPRNQKATLAELSEAANTGDADATVTDYGISSQPGGTGATVNVDNVSFNGCTTNFALKSPTGGNSGSLGGFGISSLIPS